MKSRDEILTRLGRLMWMKEHGYKEGSDGWYAVCRQITELRWVLGEMEAGPLESLIEIIPNQHQPVEIGPGWQPRGNARLDPLW